MGYIGRKPEEDMSLNVFEYTAEAGQTVFQAVYDFYAEVWVNGIKLSGSDFTAEDGLSITVHIPLEEGDIVNINGYHSIRIDEQAQRLMTLEAEIVNKAGINSAELTGLPLAPTASYSASDNSKQIVNVEYLRNETSKMSIPASVVLAGTVAITDIEIKKSFAVKAYTGTGYGFEVNTGIASENFRVTNSSGYAFTRGDQTGCVISTDPLKNLIYYGFSDGLTTDWSAQRATLSVETGSLKVTCSDVANTSFSAFTTNDIAVEANTDYVFIFLATAGTAPSFGYAVTDTTGNTTIATVTGRTVYGNGLYNIFRFNSGNNTAIKLWLKCAESDVNGVYVKFDDIRLQKEIKSGNVTINTSSIHIKSRTYGSTGTPYYGDHKIIDTIRGLGYSYGTNTTAEEANNNEITAVTADGFILGTNVKVNRSGDTYRCYQTLYTKIKWGFTNHGKFFIEAYNPVTRENLTFYYGSGLSSHKIPHSLGVELDQVDVFQLGSASYISRTGFRSLPGGYMAVNNSDAFSLSPTWFPASGWEKNSTVIANNDGAVVSTANIADTFMLMHGRANSENFAVVKCQGGKVGERIIYDLKDSNGRNRKPARLVLKWINNATTNWGLYDNAIGFSSGVSLNSNEAESAVSTALELLESGFALTYAADMSTFFLMAMAEFDTYSNGGGSYFENPTATSNLQVTNRNMIFPKGIQNGHYVNTREISAAPETIAPAWIDGINYVKKYLGTPNWEATIDKPNFGTTDFSGFGDVFDQKSGKWYKDVALFNDNLVNGSSSKWTSILSSALLVEGGKLRVQNTIAAYGKAERLITGFVVGKKYILQCDLTMGSVIGSVRLGTTSGAVDVVAENFAGGKIAFTAKSTSAYLNLAINSTTLGAYAFFDNISVYGLEDDDTVSLLTATAIEPSITYLDKKAVISSGSVVDFYDFDYPRLVSGFIAGKCEKPVHPKSLVNREYADAIATDGKHPILSMAAMLHIQEQSATGTYLSAPTGAAWNTRIFNTILKNTIDGAGLLNGITSLPAGTYYFEGSSPAVADTSTATNQKHKVAIREFGTNALLLLGTAECAQPSGSSIILQTRSEVSGFITFAEPKKIVLDHYFTTTVGYAKGLPTNVAGYAEVYADLKIWKVG